jgi:polyhydroxybutyrate depolymerase
MSVMTMRIQTIVPPATLMSLSLLLATATGCGSDPQPGPGSGGAGNASGAAGNASGGGGNANGAAGSASGGAGNTSGGAGNASGGAGNASGGAGNASGGAGNASGGAGNASGGNPSAGGSTNGGADDPMPSTGCGKTAPASGRASIDVAGTMREYILALPENYAPEKAYRLIFTWHAWGGSAQGTAGNGRNGYYGLLGASEGEAILVSPEGLPFGGDSLGWGNEGGQDIAFLNAMLERFDKELCFDKNRVFSTGFSFGGMMSNAVACSGLARAVAPMAGNSSVAGCKDGTKPVAYMGFHGDADTVVAIDGGETARDVFIERNGCGAATPSDSNWCELAGSNYQPCACTTYQGCTAGYPVTWCEFKGPHTPAPNSAKTIWDFFAQF